MKAANRIITAVAGLILIIASAMKSYQLLTEPIISRTFWESWEFFLIQIPLELGLGIWLLCGLFRKAAWLVTVFAFAVFTIVTLQKGLAGVESCGCFGSVHVDPWITFFTVDVTILLGLLIFRPKDCKLLPLPWPSTKHFFGVAIPTFVLMAVLVPVLILNKPPDKTDSYEVVKPQVWMTAAPPAKDLSPIEPPVKEPTAAEKPVTDNRSGPEKTSAVQTSELWPMLEYIDIADKLCSGVVIVLFYRNDCPDCHEAIHIYDISSRELAENDDSVRFTFIEVPPYDPADSSPIPADTPCLRGRLDSAKQWYITTPLVTVILHGSVVKSWENQAPQLDEILDAVFSGG